MNAERGYYTFSGYMGYIPQTQEYQLFATENEYREYLDDWRKP